jgi:O-antigen/teichoic acid export membrane protein
MPLLGVNLGQAVILRLDQVLVGILLGSHAAGLYSVAGTPAGVLTVVSNSVGQVTFAEAAHGQLTRKLLGRQVLLAVLTTAAAATGGVVLLPWLLPLLFGQPFKASVLIAQLLVVAQVMLAPFLVLSRAAAGYAMIRWAGGLGLLGTVLIVGAALILVPRLGLPGASLACGVTYSAMTVLIACALMIRRPWREVASR